MYANITQISFKTIYKCKIIFHCGNYPYREGAKFLRRFENVIAPLIENTHVQIATNRVQLSLLKLPRCESNWAKPK